MRDARETWHALAAWAERWGVPPPSLSVGWIDLPEAYRALAREGRIARPLFESPAAPEDEAALVAETGLALPEDLRQLHAVHDGSFAPLLPYGMAILPYAAVLTTWRSLAALADEFDDGTVEHVPSGTHCDTAYHRRWLPIAAADDLSLLLDFAPGPEGVDGQVLLQVSECSFVVVARSTTDFLDRWLRLLDESVVRFDPDYGYPVPADDQRVEALLRGGA